MPNIDFNFFRPFGPLIGVTTLPNDIIFKLNDFFDKHLDNEYKKKFDAGSKLVGNVSEELTLSDEILDKSGWKDFLFFSIKSYVKFAIGISPEQIDLHGSWIVRQYQNEYNPTHWHSGHISGVAYLKVPESYGKPLQSTKQNISVNGNIQLIHGSRMFMCDSLFTHKPKVGDFLLFPHYMMHTVFPFYGTDSERRSLSFNASIEKSLFEKAIL